MSTIEDLLEIEAIRNLRLMLSHYIDGQEMEKLASLFTEGAVCEFGEEHGGNWVGVKQIRDNFQVYADNAARNWDTLHSITNHIVTITNPDTAHGSCYLLDLSMAEASESPFTLFGVYHDGYQKVNGRWLFERIRLDFLWPRREILE